MKFSRPSNVTADPEKSKCYQKVTIVVLIESDFYSGNVKKNTNCSSSLTVLTRGSLTFIPSLCNVCLKKASSSLASM